MPVLPKAKDEKLARNLAKGTMTIQASCKDAGFTSDPAACTKKTSQPHIRERVAELQAMRAKVVDRVLIQEMESSAQIAQRVGATKEKIIQALWWNAQRCLRGTPVLDANGVQTGKYSGKPDASGANQALKLIGLECYGMFVDKVEIGGPGDFGRLTDEELSARMEADAAALGLPQEATEALLLTFQPDGTENNSDDGTENS